MPFVGVVIVKLFESVIVGGTPNVSQLGELGEFVSTKKPAAAVGQGQGPACDQNVSAQVNHAEHIGRVHRVEKKPFGSHAGEAGATERQGLEELTGQEVVSLNRVSHRR